METKLRIWFTSDTHGYLYATDFCDPAPRKQGLYSMRFPKDGNTLVIDGGDFLQGTPLTDYCHEKGLPAPLIEAMNGMGYDLLTLGNHDFSYGRVHLTDTLKALDAECVCANIIDARGETLIFPWRVRTMENGLRVGIVGMCTDWVPRWEKPESLKDYSFLPPLECARAAVEQVRAQGVDVLIGLYHGGVERDLATGEVISRTDEHIACRIAEELPFDLLLTAHQHTEIPSGTWHGTHIVQVGCNAQKYALVTMDEAGHFTSELLTPETPYVPEGARLDLYRDLEAYLDTPAGMLDRPFVPEDKPEMAMHGADLADLINAAQLDASGADISCAGLSNRLRPYEKAITLRDIMVNYPYPNTLVVRRITGAILRQALEQCAAYFSVGPDGSVRVSDAYLIPCERHFNYDYFSGIRYVFDLTRPEGDRVTELTFKGHSVRPDDSFDLVMNSYRSGGAGGFDFYTGCPVVREIRTEVVPVLLDYLKRNSPVTLPEERAYHCVLP